VYKIYLHLYKVKFEEEIMSRKNLLWVDEKTLSEDITGNIYIVTGANSGVGLETT
jgi:hypothetical protein